jgi:hypothetical protein
VERYHFQPSCFRHAADRQYHQHARAGLCTTGSLYGFRRQIASVKTWLKRFLPVSLLGGRRAAFCSRTRKPSSRRWCHPHSLCHDPLLAQGAFAASPGSPPSQKPAAVCPRAVWVAILFQFCVAVYGGYFGAGIGILILASLG